MSKFDVTRRDLIKWSMFVGAAMGLPRWKVFEVLEKSGGKALAAEAACATTNRSVHIVAGNGGFSWFQLLWPHNDVAAAHDGNFAFHAPGEEKLATGTDKPFTFGPEAPWQMLNPNRQVTALMGGSNETHTEQPVSSSTISANTSVFAAASSLQSANPTLVPVIAIDNVPFGQASGAPRPARVSNADGIVGLFNSVASRMGGTLSVGQDAQLFESTYKGLLSLHPAATRPTMQRAFTTGKVAANLLGKNLADQLRPSAADLVRYGINGSTPTKVAEIAKALCTTAKAFGMGLTSCMMVPAMRDDPHGAFNDMANLRTTVASIGKILDVFMADLLAMDDPTCGGTKIGENTVISIHGDTPKNPLDRGGWPDGTPGNSNWLYVLGAGYLKTGWMGGIKRDGTALGYDPTTGVDDANKSSTDVAQASAAAVAYAVAKGDTRRVQDFFRGDIGGITKIQQM